MPEHKTLNPSTEPDMLHGRTFLAALTLLAALATAAHGEDWPQWRGKDRDGVWRESGIVDKLPEGQIPIKWRVPIGSGYSGPTVAGSRVYVMDRVTEPGQQERVLCYDAKTGEPVWSHAYDAVYRIQYTAGPRASVTIDGGRGVLAGAMGHLFCFDATKGSILWQKDLGQEYEIRMPIWGIACSPLVEEDLVIVVAGGENACLVAFDKTTGEERWKSLDDRAQYSSPIVVDQAGRECWCIGAATTWWASNPQTGEEYWKHPMKPVQMPIGAATPVTDGRRVYRFVVLRRVVDARAARGQAGRRGNLAKARPRRATHRRVALHDQHAGARRRACLRRR